MQFKSRQFLSQSTDCRVNKDDLKRLGQVKELLALLNDPYIGPYRLVEYVEALPVLAARCRREASNYRPRAEVQRIERALNVLGNRGLEKVLLEFLEDMTVLRSELEGNTSTVTSARVCGRTPTPNKSE